MIEAVRNYIRFDLPNENGEKKRDLYNRLGVEGVVNKETGEPLEAPEITIPEMYVHLWLKFFTLSDQVSRIYDGICKRIPPSEFVAWKEMSGVEISPEEYSLMAEMDEAYCVSMNEQLEERRQREMERKK